LSAERFLSPYSFVPCGPYYSIDASRDAGDLVARQNPAATVASHRFCGQNGGRDAEWASLKHQISNDRGLPEILFEFGVLNLFVILMLGSWSFDL
jgi:hypothetical protein